MSKIKYFLIVLFLSNYMQVFSQDCSIEYSKFQTYDQIRSFIKANYKCISPLQISSNWIKDINYCKCDYGNGFLILETKNKFYVHRPIPYPLWKQFKSSESLGTFYTNHIKGKFRIEVSELKE